MIKMSNVTNATVDILQLLATLNCNMNTNDDNDDIRFIGHRSPKGL